MRSLTDNLAALGLATYCPSANWSPMPLRSKHHSARCLRAAAKRRKVRP